MLKPPVRAYYSYAAEDAQAGAVLDQHLSLLRREGLLTSWHRHCLRGGDLVEAEAQQHLATADLILILLSADYVANEGCFAELQGAIARKRAGQAEVYLIHWRPVERQHPDLLALGVLPQDGLPIATRSMPDTGWCQVATALRRRLSALDAPPPAPVAAAGFAYDVFVSYAAKDPERTWVRKWLVPALEAAGLRVCLDIRDFHLSQPQIEEMERAVQASRYTLCVLTPAYLESGFSALENVMAQHLGRENHQGRLIAVLRQPCTPRLGLRISPPLDMTDEADAEEALLRLIAALRQPSDRQPAG